MSLDDFFVEMSKRREKRAYFYRINRTSDVVERFLYQYYDTARRTGVVVDGRIANPTEGNLSYYGEIMGMDFRLSTGFIAESLKKWLPRLDERQRESVAYSIYDCLDKLRKAGKTENMLKNAYIKFMCWLYYKFERIVGRLGENNVPKILYCGVISNYELLLITILNRAGCDVLLVQTAGDEEYRKLDPASERSDVYDVPEGKAFPKDFSLRQLCRKFEQEEQNRKIFGDGAGIRNCTNAWIGGEGLADILKAPADRGGRPDLFYNCYCRISGVEDKLTYANELYQFYLSLQNEKRRVVVENGRIPKPTPDEIMRIRRGNYGTLEQMLLDLQTNIQCPASKELRGLLAKAFAEVITEESKEAGMNLHRLLNKAVYLLCWIKRYQGRLFQNWKLPEVGCFIYMGGCKDANEALFLKYLARIPADVLILCPNLNERCCLEDTLLYEINHQVSMTLERFPEQDVQIHIGTAAYHAERELDTLMYQDSGMYRNQQFTKANIILLQTMDREIKILWNNELKFRPNFSTVDGIVNLPVIFAKMSGVKDRDVENYWTLIRQLMTPETLVIDHAPFLTAAMPNPLRMYATEFLRNGKLKREKIKNHPGYPYAFLREEMQEHILDKLEVLIEQRLIKGTFENGTEYTIVSVALNLPKEAVRLLQQFDFTKRNPKLIYLITTETLMSPEDSIYVTFLSLLGFDVLFYVPTGYNIENHFNKKRMEEHQLGDYMYDLQVPDWNRIPSAARKSWRDKIFKRG
ncbi:MAG: hypothetical protein HFG88_08180 [Dorea sp.]|nr:hypothetical protein [Dorea sp.]